MLNVERVDTYYGEIQALREVSLQVEEGQIVSIIGSNGAGKTTTLNTISGVLQAQSGRIDFLGKRIENSPPHEIVEMGIVQVPEGRLLFPFMTTLENLELGAYTQRARENREENLKEVFKLFPVLEERKNQLAGTLSGGEQQMLAIGRGLMASPKLLMLDEPSLGLAPFLVQQVFETVKEINSRGITVLLVEQNVFHSLAITHEAYVLENGRVVLGGKGKELLDNPQVKEAYLGL